MTPLHVSKQRLLTTETLPRIYTHTGGAHIYSFCFGSHWQFVTQTEYEVKEVYYVSKEKNGLCLIPLIIAWKNYHLNTTFPSWQVMCPSLRHRDGEAAISSILGKTEGPPKHFSSAEAPWSPPLKARPSEYWDPGSPPLGWAGGEQAVPHTGSPRWEPAAAVTWQWMCVHGASQARAQLAGRLGLGGGLGAWFVQHSGQLASKSIWEISV